MNLTTDSYIEKFLPFKIIKDVMKIFIFIFEEDLEITYKAKIYLK